MSISMGVSVEDVMFMLISYIAGMIVTSLMINKDRYSNRISHNPYEAYEHVIADLMARIDVIDLRVKRIYSITESLYNVSHHMEGNYDYYSRVDEIERDNSTSSDDYKGAPSMAKAVVDDDGSDADASREGRSGMNGKLMIISSYHDANDDVAMKEEGKGDSSYRHINNSTIEKILSIIQEGPKTSREIEKRLGMSREHTARLMKRLYEMGYVIRDESKRPYKYILAQTDDAKKVTNYKQILS